MGSSVMVYYGAVAELILASASLQRVDLLKQLGLEFKVVPPSIVEPIFSGGDCCEFARETSFFKARAVSSMFPDAVIVAADTFGILDGEFIGKPVDGIDAVRILRKLSGRCHMVVTGFTVMKLFPGETISRCVKTLVYFRTLSDIEIEGYVATGEPVGRAGAYAIQGKGAILVDRLDGDYFNVAGLPLAEFASVLRRFGLDVLNSL